MLQRLVTQAQFQAVMRCAPILKTQHFALHALHIDSTHACAPLFAANAVHLGLVLPKRHAKRAVTRNTLRRQIYEQVRTQPLSGLGYALVVRLRREFDRNTFISATSKPLKQAAKAELQLLFQQWMQRCNRMAESSQ